MAYLGAGITRFNTADGLTVKGTAEFTDTVVLGDSDELRFGAGEDLKIYHDASNSYIQDAGTGALIIRSNSFQAKSADNTTTMFTGAESGAVELYHNNVKRIETTGSGATVTGTLAITGNLSAPSQIVHTGDSDTFIEFNDADNMRFVTGNTAKINIQASAVVVNEASNDFDFRVESNGNANMLFVDAGNDRVGIGTSSPSAGLEVEDANGVILSRSGYSQYLQLQPANNSVPTILGEGGNGVHLGPTSTTGIRVDSNGNVGIGAASPSFPLTIENSANHLYLKQSNQDNGWLINTADADGELHVSRRGEGASPSNNERLTISTVGNMGIGTSSLDSRLEINSASSATSRIKLKLNDTPYCYFGGYSGIVGGGNADDVALFAWTGKQLMFGTNASERMRIDSSGNLLHQRTSSNTISGTSINKMTLGDGTGQYGVIVDVGSGSGYYGFARGGTYNSRIRYDYTSNFMAFDVNQSERMHIDSSGNVGINTSTFENTNGTELNLKGGTNNSKPAVITLQGAASNGAGYKQTEVFGISGVSSATEITRITGTGSNGMRMLIYVTAVGHTASHANAHTINKYYWDGGTNAPQTISIEASTYGAPGITFDVTTSNRCIIKLTSGNGTGSFNGIMEVQWFVPIDFASSTWQVS